MRRIETPTQPGIFGYSMPHWRHIEILLVYRAPVVRHTENRLSVMTTELRTRTVGSIFKGTPMRDIHANAEWFNPSWWDRMRLRFARWFRYHNPPKRMFTVTK